MPRTPTVRALGGPKNADRPGFVRRAWKTSSGILEPVESAVPNPTSSGGSRTPGHVERVDARSAVGPPVAGEQLLVGWRRCAVQDGAWRPSTSGRDSPRRPGCCRSAGGARYADRTTGLCRPGVGRHRGFEPHGIDGVRTRQADAPPAQTSSRRGQARCLVPMISVFRSPRPWYAPVPVRRIRRCQSAGAGPSIDAARDGDLDRT
jgi:hypothetical protein